MVQTMLRKRDGSLYIYTYIYGYIVHVIVIRRCHLANRAAIVAAIVITKVVVITNCAVTASITIKKAAASTAFFTHITNSAILRLCITQTNTHI